MGDKVHEYYDETVECAAPSGNRMSSLPIAQFCGLAPKLAKSHGAGRAAAVSNVAHARAAGNPKWKEMRETLTEAEQADLDARHDPPSLFIDTELEGPGPLMKYRALKEFEVMLTESLGHTYNSEEAVSVGHPDLAWCLDNGKSKRVAIMDIKANRWTVPEGPNGSLQLHAYGIACCEMWGCEGYWPGLFFSEDGTYEWGEYVDLMSDEGDRIRRRVRAAILNDGEASTGPHCSDCYSRMHCPEYTLKGVEGVQALQGMGSGEELTPEGASEALEWFYATKSLLSSVESNLKAYAKQSGGIPFGESKLWKPIKMKGKKGVNVKKLASLHPEVYEEVYEEGAPYESFRKVNR